MKLQSENVDSITAESLNDRLNNVENPAVADDDAGSSDGETAASSRSLRSRAEASDSRRSPSTSSRKVTNIELITNAIMMDPAFKAFLKDSKAWKQIALKTYEKYYTNFVYQGFDPTQMLTSLLTKYKNMFGPEKYMETFQFDAAKLSLFVLMRGTNIEKAFKRTMPEGKQAMEEVIKNFGIVSKKASELNTEDVTASRVCSLVPQYSMFLLKTCPAVTVNINLSVYKFFSNFKEICTPLNACVLPIGIPATRALSVLMFMF